ncbi:hypothetical protein HMPREF3200_01722, partial [Anaerococcus tetradius]
MNPSNLWGNAKGAAALQMPLGQIPPPGFPLEPLFDWPVGPQRPPPLLLSGVRI